MQRKCFHQNHDGSAGVNWSEETWEIFCTEGSGFSPHLTLYGSKINLPYGHWRYCPGRSNYVPYGFRQLKTIRRYSVQHRFPSSLYLRNSLRKFQLVCESLDRSDLLCFGVGVATIQETHCLRCWCSCVVIYLAYVNQLTRVVSLLVKRTLDANVDLVHVDAEGTFDCGRYCHQQ